MSPDAVGGFRFCASHEVEHGEELRPIVHSARAHCVSVVMTGLGQHTSFECLPLTSALPPKADIGSNERMVACGPGADSCTAAKTADFKHTFGAERSPSRQY
jgi:hypothetical protein